MAIIAQRRYCSFMVCVGFISNNYIIQNNLTLQQLSSVLVSSSNKTQYMSDSDLSSSKSKHSKKKNSFNQLSNNKSSLQKSKIVIANQQIEDQTGLHDQNKRLRKKLKELSVRLDDELEKAAENRLKVNSMKIGHPVSQESQNLQLQNSYKMIERLQKAVKEYESKESYQVTLKRVQDLQNIIKKKQNESEELKLEIKTLKKTTKDKERHIEDLIEAGQKMSNPNEDKEVINRLKAKLKKIQQDNELLRRKELEKHQKLVKAERRLVQIEQNQNQLPIGREETLLQELQDYKNKFKEAMKKVERQNIYITKLNEKLDHGMKGRKSQTQTDRKNISKSMEELPDLTKRKIQASEILEHIPSPKIAIRLKRY